MGLFLLSAVLLAALFLATTGPDRTRRSTCSETHLQYLRNNYLIQDGNKVNFPLSRVEYTAASLQTGYRRYKVPGRQHLRSSCFLYWKSVYRPGILYILK